MSSSSRDTASRLREMAGKTLLERAQLRERGAQQELKKIEGDLAESRRAHKQSNDEADAQLKTLCVAFDTLIEFILLNHGEIPDKLVEIIAARQEQRIAASLPKADFINQGVQEGDEATAELRKYVVGAPGQPALLRHLAKDLVRQASDRAFGRLNEESIKRDLLERLAKASDD